MQPRRSILWLGLGTVLASANLGAAQPPANYGQVQESLSLASALLAKPVEYSIYLPPDYAHSTRRYPVLYLLHGFTDDETAWVQFGEAQVAADQGIRSGEVPPLIIVMPDGGITWYVNDASGSVPYERMLVEELIPYLDSHYRTRADREFRAVSGLSMGGFGSLMLAMRHPELFSACVAFSSGLMTDDEVLKMDQENWDRVLGAPFGRGLSGAARLTAHFREYSPLDLALTRPVEELKKVAWYLDCGDDDFLAAGNSALHLRLRERQIPHEYRVRDGAHRWVYWRTGIRDGLRFIGEVFHR